MPRIVVGISGASGVILGYIAVKELLAANFFVDLIMSKAAHLTAKLELQPKMSLPDFLKDVSEEQKSRLHIHKIGDVGASVASGSYATDGMLVIPCSMATLSAIALGLSDNLLRRAADVTLKERRRLVMVPRETPFSELHLEHMLKITKMGGCIVPPSPAWYTKPQTIRDMENFIVGKALDLFKVPHNLYPRWKS